MSMTRPTDRDIVERLANMPSPITVQTCCGRWTCILCGEMGNEPYQGATKSHAIDCPWTMARQRTLAVANV